MSGGAPLDEVDGYSVTIVDNDNPMTLQLTSNVKGMHVLEDTQADRDSGIVGPDADNSTTGQSCLTTFFGRLLHFVCLSINQSESCIWYLYRRLKPSKLLILHRQNSCNRVSMFGACRRLSVCVCVRACKLVTVADAWVHCGEYHCTPHTLSVCDRLMAYCTFIVWEKHI